MQFDSTTTSLGSVPVPAHRPFVGRRRVQQEPSEHDDNAGTPFDEKKIEPVKVGFGRDSVKIPSLAANTIKRNVRQAKMLIPTLEESEARVRDRVATEETRAVKRDAQRVTPLAIQNSREAAIDAARSFISSVNGVIGESRFRTGQGAQPEANRLDVRIGDQLIPYVNPTARMPLDLLA